MENNSSRKNKTPKESKIIRGEPANTRSSWANRDTIKRRATPSMRKRMTTKTRGERWGRKGTTDEVSRAEQEGEGATIQGSAGEESQSARPGLEHPG